MDDGKIFEGITNVVYIHYRKYNGTILKNTIIMKLGESFKNYYILFHLTINLFQYLTFM